MLTAESLVAELALGGRLQPHELRRWLQPLGIGEQAAVLVFAPAQAEEAVPLLEGVLAQADARGVVVEWEGLLCAVVDCPLERGAASREAGASSEAGAAREAGASREAGVSREAGASREADEAASQETRAAGAGPGGARGGDPGPPLLELAARARRELRERLGDVRAAASRPAPTEALRRSFHEARCALEAARAANGEAPEVASYEDLGGFRLLLSLQDGDALASYCDTVLGPVETEEGEYGEELLRSLDAFIEHNGHWEQAARALYCHRHTLRYRVRRVEQLTGRDFSHARDRIELWLALRGRELAH